MGCQIFNMGSFNGRKRAGLDAENGQCLKALNRSIAKMGQPHSPGSGVHGKDESRRSNKQK